MADLRLVPRQFASVAAPPLPWLGSRVGPFTMVFTVANFYLARKMVAPFDVRRPDGWLQANTKDGKMPKTIS